MNIKLLLAPIYFYLFFQCLSLNCLAQGDTLEFDKLLKLKVEDMYKINKDDMLNAIVTIASKKAESIFDAPLSTSVISREDILRSGATNIGEALRLFPGLVVFEQTNGNFDIHLRGGGNRQRNSLYSISSNTTTLVMIDNRPIYNYYEGGTLWETIPIDLHDIDRIELVRGPASALYGPNAASGVINIITRDVQKDGFNVIALAQQGSDDIAIGNLAVGYNTPNYKYNGFNAILSINTQLRDRGQNTYYSIAEDRFVERDAITTDTTDNLSSLYPDVDLAMKRYGLNGFLSYRSEEQKMNIDLDLGWQDSEVQKVYSENLQSPLNTSRSETGYANLRFRKANFLGQFAYQRGTQEEGLDRSVGSKWDFNTLDALMEYEITLDKRRLSIQPGLNFRRAVYDDTPFFDASMREGFLNTARSLNTFAAFVRGDWSFWKDRMRVIGGVRLDKFNFPDEPYFSYQAAITYKPTINNLFRLVVATAHRNASLLDTHIDRLIDDFSPSLELLGNRDLKLLTVQLVEFGYRRKVNDNLWLNLEVFGEYEKDFTEQIENSFLDNGNTLIQQSLNIPLKVREYGATLEATYRKEFYSQNTERLNSKISAISVRAFLTYNRIRLRNSSDFLNSENAFPSASNLNDPTQNNLNSGQNTNRNHQGSPDWYGGFVINYNWGNMFNINLNSYFYTGQNYFYFPNYFFNNGVAGIGTVPGKFILNLKTSFSPIPLLDVFVNIRNLTDSRKREYYNVDTIGLRYMFGIQVEL